MKKFVWSEKKQRDYLEDGILKHLHRERLRLIAAELNEVLATGYKLKCLDLGCGDGIFMKYFSTYREVNFVGCDADYYRLLRAKEYCRNLNFVNALAENTPFRNYTFDLLLLHHVLEHAEDDKKMLSECSRILKPNGIFILGVPNENSINGRISRFLQPGLYKKGEHLNFYSENEILNVLKLFNFRILKVKRVGFLFPGYYIHILLVSNRITFSLGNLLTKILKFCADSLIVVCQKV